MQFGAPAHWAIFTTVNWAAIQQVHDSIGPDEISAMVDSVRHSGPRSR